MRYFATATIVGLVCIGLTRGSEQPVELTVLPVIHAVKTAGTHGWSASVGAFALAGTLAAVAFVRRQRRAAHPMLDVSLFRVPGFGGSIAIQVIGMFGMMGHGILGTQYTPYYQGLIMERLIQVGYADDLRIERGFEWLLAVRQGDGGWMIPIQTVSSQDREIWSQPPIPFDETLPSSHFATGMVLRAFAVHPRRRRLKAALRAGEFLKSRFFQRDEHSARRAPHYWTKFQYPHWWPNLLTALDSLARLGDKIRSITLDGRSLLVEEQDYRKLRRLEPRPEGAVPVVNFLPYEDHFPKAFIGREWFLPEEALELVTKKGTIYSGQIFPSVWVNGEVAGGWELIWKDKKKSAAEIKVTGLISRWGENKSAAPLVEEKRRDLEEFVNGQIIPLMR